MANNEALLREDKSESFPISKDDFIERKSSSLEDYVLNKESIYGNIKDLENPSRRIISTNEKRANSNLVIEEDFESNGQPYDLKCEYLTNPIGIDVSKPRISWKISEASHHRGRFQTEYQILVSSSKILLERGIGDLWNSGWVNSSESVNILYNGKPIEPNCLYFWKVRIKDESGKVSDWSDISFWRSGLLQEDWKAKWIGSAEMEAQSHSGEEIEIPANTSATLKLHNVEFDSITESGNNWKNADCVSLEAIEGNVITFRINSGCYSFSAKRTINS